MNKRKYKLSLEKEITPRQIVKQNALDLLARREHSQQELCNKLQIRGYLAEDIAWVLAELAGLELQSDQRFAEAYTQQRIRKGFGPLHIQAELKQRGITEDIISSVLDQGKQFWLQQARRVHTKKYGTTLPRDFKTQAQQMRFLQSRGFPAEYFKGILAKLNVTDYEA